MNGAYYEFAYFGWGDLSQQFYGYCEGYKESADYLIDAAIQSERISRIDTVVFPVLFLYRQFIELSLKRTVLFFSNKSSEEKAKWLKKANHNLRGLWKDYLDILPSSQSDSEKRTIEIVGKYIAEFHDVDKSSFSFRYPITKNMNLIFGEDKRINLKHLRDRMEEIYNFFSGTHDDLQYIRECELEIQAEFESYFY